MPISPGRRKRLDRVSVLITEGKPIRAIAADTRVSYKQAYDDVQLVLADEPVGDIAEYRKLMAARLDRMQQALDAELDAVDIDTEKTVGALLRIEERRAKLLGLDAPVRAEVDVRNVTVKLEGAEDL